MIVTREELERFKAFMGFDVEKAKPKPKKKRGRPKGSKNKRNKWL
tara:strand:+ start:6027 stop:6161 length:135 start_codon:yes stop_codon:yes gene_type:complete